MRHVYLTVDVEEWYDLDYLKDCKLRSTDVEVVPRLIDFLDVLDSLNIKATFFVLGNLAEKYADIIRDIAQRGHAIGCHGLDHELLYAKDNSNFFDEIAKAKALIEEYGKCVVNGYRASCFSMEREKLELVKKAGYKYDSSKILFKQHPLYRNLNLDGFESVEKLVYKENDFFEYEIPTMQIGRFEIPISGGGYLRLMPFWLIKILIKKYVRENENFLIYVHPFELTDIPLPFPKEIGFKNRFRASVGRKNNIRKLTKILLMLQKMGAQFRTLEEDRQKRIELESNICNTY